MNLVDARTPAVVLASLALVGAALWPLRAFVNEAGATNPHPSKAGLPGLTAARWTSGVMPGAMRALMADGLWLKAYAAWAARDRLRTEALIQWVTAVDDRPLHFWVNGARIIACDVPEWRLQAMDTWRVPSEVRRRVMEEQACAALEYLDAARNCHPESAAIWVEMGNIHLYKRGDLVRAAECYRRAAESPGAPYYAARVYADSYAGWAAIRRPTSGSAGFTQRCRAMTKQQCPALC